MPWPRRKLKKSDPPAEEADERTVDALLRLEVVTTKLELVSDRIESQVNRRDRGEES